VAIVGGTHGNEKNGVYLAKYFQSSEQARSRPSFESTVILSNVAAIKKNVRYVEEDMNRCFFMKDLANAEHTATLEARRAKEIDGIIGPKRPKLAPAMDFVIDLHNTTANTGVALMRLLMMTLHMQWVHISCRLIKKCELRIGCKERKIGQCYPLLVEVA